MGRLHRDDQRLGKDKRDSDIWMVSWDGTRQVRLTSRARTRVEPALEPGRALSSRSCVAGRRGGQEEGRAGLAARSRGRRGAEADRREGRRERVRLVARRQAPRARRRRSGSERRGRRRRTASGRPSRRSSSTATTSSRTASGYLGAQRTHLYLFDVATKTAETLTSGRVRRGVARRGRPTASRSRS